MLRKLLSKKFVPAIVGLSLVAVTLVAPISSVSAKDTAPKPIDPKTIDATRRLRLIGTNGVQQMDPVTGAVTCEAEMLRWLYDTLIRLTPDGQLVPGLAESWGREGKNFVLHLRHGVIFQDGTKFNAAAVKAHILRAKTLAKSVLATSLKAVDSVETPDPFTVVLVLNEGRAGVLPILFTDRAGMVPSPTAVANAGATYGATSAVGAGPYKYDKYVSAVDFHVSAWKGYWDTEHRHLAGIDMLGSATELQIQRVISGDVDYAAMKDIQLPEAVTGKSVAPKKLDYRVSPTDQYSEIYLNWNIAPFNNVLVRQALEYSLDRKTLASVLTANSAIPSTSPLASTSWGHDAKAVDSLYKYDPVKAKALLAQAGFPNGITVDVGMIQNTYYVALSEAVQAMVKASGFTFNLKSVSGAQINNRLYTLKDLPIAITAYRGSPDPGLTLEAKFMAKGSANASSSSVPGIDTLLIKSAGATDATLRAKWLKEAELLVMQGAYSIPIYHNAGLVAFTPEFVGTMRGYTTCQFGDFVSAEVYFKKKNKK